MLPPLIDIALFRDAIEGNQLILTANQRLAAQIQQAWGLSLVDTASVWKAPKLMSMEHWLSDCWHQLQDQHHPLSKGLAAVGRLQSGYYWECAIAQQGQSAEQSFATMADNCLDLLQRWNLHFDTIQETSTAAYKFKRWATNYQRLLDKQGLATTATTWAIVRDAFLQSALPREQKILLYGFQSLSPLQQSVLEAASDQVVEIQPENKNVQQFKVQCLDPAQELQAATSWAAKQLSAQPEQRIGILLPDLSNDVQRTVRVINEALAAQNCATVVNISAGTKLAETPLIGSAFAFLEILNYQLPLEHWLRIVYSPYSNFEQLEVQFRVNCELSLRETKSHQLSFDKFVQLIRGCQAVLDNPDWVQPQLQPLYDLQQALRHNASDKKTFTQWAEFFNQLIRALGWPGVKQPNSLQYQQLQHWDKLLSHYAELDNLDIQIGRSTALNYLQRLANEHLFHPQTGDAPLQVLGLLEAVGLQFDQLWIVGMHSGNLPTTGAMDPVLPAAYQRINNMPFSVPEKELQIAKNLLESFQCNAKQLMLSFPLTDGKTPLEPSPLIQAIPEKDLHKIVDDLDLPIWLAQPYQCQLVKDMGYAFNASTESISGGSRLLKNQSTCPFNAFAIHRLWAKALEQPSIGLEPVDRGSIVHEILYRLWNHWQSSQVLSTFSAQQLSEQIEVTIDAVLVEKARHNLWLLGNNFKQLEHRRLSKLILQWIEVEKQRQPFEVVSVEYTAKLSFADLDISLSIDRLDSVNGHTLVIDYKTGKVNASDWLGERPKDPQLPLYALATEPQPLGCAFALLKGNDPKFKGLSNEPLISGVEIIQDWPSQIEQWHRAITDLAREFVEGKGTLTVYNKGEFTYQTDLLPLNRWHEQVDIQRLLINDKTVL